MTEHLLSTLGLALRAGAVAVGEEPVGAAARGKKARVIFTARDAAASSVRRAYSFAHAGSCLCLPFPADKDAFGRALGRTSVAMCAVTDIGFAQSLVKKLAAAEPEIYGAAAEALDLKAKQARERKEEQLQHEKNLRQGRHRVHGGKPPEPPHASPEPPAPEHRPPAPEHRRPPRREYPEGRPDRVYKERSGRPPRDKRSAKKEAPGARYENARPVKKGKGSRKTTGR